MDAHTDVATLLAERPDLAARLLLLADKPMGKAITNPEQAHKALTPLLGGRDREHFVALALDRRHRIIAAEILTVGSDGYTVVDPRMVYRWALQQGTSAGGASAIIIAHNHPSGDPSPSTMDRTVTDRVSRAGRMLGIPLLDHIVYTDHNGCTSLAEEGRCDL